MMRRGEPLGAVAAALASPETAERIAVLEAATAGRMSALEAARLNVQRAGHDLTLLDGLRGVGGAGHAAVLALAEEDELGEEVARGAGPLALARRRS